MQPLKKFSVVARLPEKLLPLWDLAYNYWFAWNPEIRTLFSSMDYDLWQTCSENPVSFLNRLPQQTLETFANDEFFLQRLADADRSLNTYLHPTSSLFDEPDCVGSGGPVIAYFSFEYGISRCLPIYSGGLGILAGDHLKSASDLNVPLVGVGLCYRGGYFRQYLTPDGWQQESYPDNDFEELPLKLCENDDGSEVRVNMNIGEQSLQFRVWKAQIGRVTLLLLDTDLPENPPELTQLTARLYGGDLEMRLKQEMLLGIGGVKALAAMNLHPSVIHMNEGHSAFAGVERIRIFMQEHGLSFETAMELVASTSVFTTHTPVPAGNDRFPPELITPYFDGYAKSMGLSGKVFLALGREDPRDDAEHFCMTVLALKLSRFNNGVSELHGHVSRSMWINVWPQHPAEDVPIGAITNGVHMPTWVAGDLSQLYDRYLGATWKEDPDCERVWANANSIPDSELWRTHERLRERLVDFVRKRLRKQLLDKGARKGELEVADEVLDPQALTIGFARRFATYKRASLILQDRDRLIRLINNPDRPVQFIFAGKAHPADSEGKKLIQELVELCRSEECRYSMVFLEDYDMRVASRMLQGCDIWLNTPRRPLEACGTSGMKAMANGVLQFSTLDGWWDEAYLKDNSLGYAIGKGEEYADPAYQDFVECRTLYNVLENEILPEFYERGHGNLPRTWIHKMKKALRHLGPRFSAHRMVEDYMDKAYRPACRNYALLAKDQFAAAKDLAQWRMELMTSWGDLQIREVKTSDVEKIHVNDTIEVEAHIHLGSISPENVRVEIYQGPLTRTADFSRRTTTSMEASQQLEEGVYLYKGQASPMEPGRFGLTLRVMPRHPLLLDPRSLGLIRWAS